MAEHLARATATRDAVVHGRFDEAKAGFNWLASHDEQEGGAWLAQLSEAAARGEAATSSQEQAMALGELANTCGGCHQSLDRGPLLPELPAPAEGEGLHTHMAQHAWANDRMWAALVEPSSAAWERSLRVLGDQSVPAADIADWGLPERTREMDAAIHQLAHAALADDNPDTRADLYGQIVGQCAGCHLAAREAAPQ